MVVAEAEAVAVAVAGAAVTTPVAIDHRSSNSDSTHRELDPIKLAVTESLHGRQLHGRPLFAWDTPSFARRRIARDA